MAEFELAGRPDPAEYMASVAALPAGQAYKARALRLLEVAPGMTVLDAGCGPGADLNPLRSSVGDRGRVVGVDVDATMLSRAAEVAGGGAELLLADLHELPLESAVVDRVKVDRVLQHVRSPHDVLAELLRVTRPGGLAVAAEPDWGTLVVDSSLPAISASFTRFTCEHVVRNATLGRELGRVAEQAGWTRDHVEAVTSVFLDLQTADRVLGLGRNSRQAVEAGWFTEEQRADWLSGLAERPVYAAATIVITRLRA
jgi:ubiquinone/menaquinone biosynthesis C-methylase UbiE